VLPVDGGDAEAMLAQFAKLGIDEAALAARLQSEGTQSFDKSWADLLQSIAAKSTALKTRSA
jgi:transaldolase